MKVSKIKHGWNSKTHKSICGTIINLLTMQKALWVESDKKNISCKKCLKLINKQTK